MNIIIRVCFFISTILLLVFISACKSESPTYAGKVVLALFDVSERKNKEDKIDKKIYYKDFVDKVLPMIELGDTMVVSIITDNPLDEISISKTFKEPIKSDYPSDYIYKIARQKKQKEMEKEKEDIIKPEVKKLLEKSSPVADIFGSMYYAEHVFDEYNKDDRRLVIMSNMRHVSTDSDQELSVIIENEKEKRNGLPYLKDVKVYVWGARAKDTDTVLFIKRFWRKYFENCKAMLIYYGRSPPESLEE